MSDPTGVFEDENKSQATPEKEATGENPFADQLGAIVNEGGEQKYATVEKALEALKVSQNEYIPTLKASLDESQKRIAALETELAERQSLAEVVDKLTSGDVDKESTPATPSLTEEKVLSLIKNYDQTSKTEAVRVMNGEKVTEVLTQKFGEKTKDVVAEKAKELGTTPSRLGELARENPDLVLQLFNEGSPSRTAPSTSSIQMPTSPSSEQKPLERPEKSLLGGATAAEQLEYMKKIKAEVYRDLNVET